VLAFIRQVEWNAYAIVNTFGDRRRYFKNPPANTLDINVHRFFLIFLPALFRHRLMPEQGNGGGRRKRTAEI
jgi:hypothetical protein